MPLSALKRLSFDKPAISLPEQISLLKARGLIISDVEYAKHVLTYIGYYHFSAYQLPFQKADKSSAHHQFNDGTKFEDILDSYNFDRQLRLLVMDAIERIEIAIRAVIINQMSIPYDPHWYMDKNYFIPEFNHEEMLQKIQKDINHGMSLSQIRDICIRHYYQTYDAPAMPPIWMIFESLSFSTISRIYKNLNHADQKRIAADMNLPVRVLGSWLHSIAYTRNLCAHHQRLWNRIFTIKPLIANDVPGVANVLTSNAKFYAQAVTLYAMMKIISPESQWAQRLKSLVEKFPNVSLRHMGFPDTWKNERFWD